MVVGLLAHDAVPLVDDDDELASDLTVDVCRREGQAGVSHEVEVAVLASEVSEHPLLEKPESPFNLVRCREELLHVEAHYVVAVVAVVEAGGRGALHAGELRPAVDRAVVVGTYHDLSSIDRPISLPIAKGGLILESSIQTASTDLFTIYLI